MRRIFLLLLLLGTSGMVLARDLGVEVVEPPTRLGEAGTTSILQGSFPGLRVVPTGSGELVLSGPRATLAAAVELLRKLDRPPREVVVEVSRGSTEHLLDSEARLGLGLGGEEAPSALRRAVGAQRSSGGQSLRLQEGGEATLFVGDEVPYTTGGFLPETRFVSAGAGVRVRLVRVEPGEGALLELSAEQGGLGASTPAGPSIQRNRVSTRVFAPFGVLTPVGTFTSATGSTSHGGGMTGSLTIEETRRPDPNAGYRQGSTGLPTGRFVRRPLRGSLSTGRRVTSGSGGGSWQVRVREVPPARGAPNPRH